MAAKKKAKKKTAKKSASKEIAVGWQAQLAAHAKEGKAPKEKALTGDYISTKGAKFSLGGAVLGREIDCCILGWNFEKSWYDSAFVDGEASAPACFAISYDEDEMTPHETSPNMQGDSDGMCEGCELNEWGSGKGEGKACADRRRLALVVEGTNGDMELKMLNISPSSLKNWKGFINGIEKQGIHVMQAAVNIHFDEDSTAAYPPICFEFLNEITNESTLDATAALLPEATTLLEQPYDVSNYEKPGGEKKTAKKKAKKKSNKKSKFS